MNQIGKIRIKNIEMLLPPNSHLQINEKFNRSAENTSLCHHLSPKNLNLPIEICDSSNNQKIDTNLENPLPCCQNSLSAISLKTENINPDSISVDCVDLTEDTLVTQVRKNTATNKQRIDEFQGNKLTNSKAKHETKPQKKHKTNFAIKSSAVKIKHETPSQTKLLSFFTPRSNITKAPKKQENQPAINENTNSLEDRPLRVLRKFSLRRKLLKADDELEENKKPKNEGREIKKTNKSKLKDRPERLSNSRSANKAKNIKKLEDVSEPTVIPGVIDLCLDSDSDVDEKLTINPPQPMPKRPATVKSEKSICPSYKVIEGTTFAVDGFKFGRIEGVTAYFLSHFHSDHYIGLTKKFSMPIYVSQITANLMREFIPVDENFVNVLLLNNPTTIEGVQVTAIDANHCPGAVMFLFQLQCGKRILHTGDFRASIAMESDSNLCQRNIDLLYLDTTYISNNYSFQTQEKSIADAFKYVREFKQRNEGNRILFVVGSYLVGKEKFWLPIAKEFNFKIWTDSNRRKVMHALNDEEILKRLVAKPQEADMHIISMMKVGYRGIESYWEDHCDAYDMVFAIRPSGWEKNSKPQFRGRLNIVGIEYSEHSSHNELRRFLSFLKPKQVISTVPNGKDQTKCPDVPLSWYKKECFSPIKKQASLLNYFKSSNIENKNS